jgi:four helix bundle protein
MVNRFQDLIVWQLADQLRREIVQFTDSGPASKDFRFRTQMREAIASACRNSSEGFDRFRPGVFANHLEIAKGSLGEVQDCLIDAQERRFIDGDDFDRMWRLSKRAIGANRNLTVYLRNCAAKGLEPWRRPKREKSLPDGERTIPDSKTQPEAEVQNRPPGTWNREPEPGTEEQALGTENQNQEPGT